MTYNPNEIVEVPKIGMLKIGVPKISMPNVFGKVVGEKEQEDGIVPGKTIIVTATTDSVDLTINGVEKTYAVTPNVPSKIVVDFDTINRIVLGANIVAIDLSNCNITSISFYTTSYYNSALQTFILPKNTIYVRDISMFVGGSKINNLDLSNCNFFNCTGTLLAFRLCRYLSNLKFGYNLKLGINLGDSPLTHESALSVINGLAEVTTPQTVTFKSTTYDTLTEEEIAMATSKGWSVASV